MPAGTNGARRGGQGRCADRPADPHHERRARAVFRAVLLLGALLVAACYQSWSPFADIELDGDAGLSDDAGSVDGGDTGPDSDAPVRCPVGMVFVPGGPFVMGADPGEVDYDPSAEPEHQVYVSPFCIDTLEVTNANWRDCVEAGGCTLPHVRPDYRCPGGSRPDLHPVNCVDHVQAGAYCAWAGKRLPTEAEWEKAARGGCDVVAPAGCGSEDERDYPWGEAPPAGRCCDYVFCELGTDEVGARPLGAGPYGTLDQVGNVWEWVADYHDPAAYTACAAGCADPTGAPSGDRAVIRGGLINDDLRVLCTWRPVAWRTALRCVDYTGTIGFRCAVRP